MGIKKYLPFEHYTLTTHLSADEVRKRLSENVVLRRNVSFMSGGASAKPYAGQISGNSFTISRVIQYRNSFLPVITGQISTFLSRTQITIKMKPDSFVVIFICLWLGIVGLICLGLIIVGILKFNYFIQHGFSPMSLIPFGMFVFGILLVSIGFKAESKKSKEFFRALFEGQEIE